LRERVAKLESKAAVGESRQLSLEGKIDEAMTIPEVMHCNVETVAAFSKDVRESLGGPPLNNLPPLDSPDEDQAEENESDYN
jgi:hypothetical protein